MFLDTTGKWKANLIVPLFRITGGGIFVVVVATEVLKGREKIGKVSENCSSTEQYLLPSSCIS